MNKDCYVMIVLSFSHLRKKPCLRQPSHEKPHSSFTSTLSQLRRLRLVVAVREPTLGSPSEVRTCGRPWCLLGKEICKLLEQKFSECSDICLRTNCCFPTSETFGFPRSARLGMSGACCSLVMYYCFLFCSYSPVFFL